MSRHASYLMATFEGEGDLHIPKTPLSDEFQGVIDRFEIESFVRMACPLIWTLEEEPA